LQYKESKSEKKQREKEQQNVAALIIIATIGSCSFCQFS
jgi:hypothetical protein